MVFKQRYAIIFFLSSLGLSNMLFCENSNEETIPPLPTVDQSIKIAEPQEDKSKEEDITAIEEPILENPAFFTDNSASKGFSRYLNALELSGYFRLRLKYFNNAHLGTYIPFKKHGTSGMLPNLSLVGKTTEDPVTPDADDEDTRASKENPSQSNFSSNMRLRLDPTINISEVTRIRSTFDVFDNFVLGSTPSYMAQGSPSPRHSASFMSMSQNAPELGLNSLNSAIKIKRLWGEASFALGELRFGRTPFHWGLGMLYNSGDGIDDDYGDQVDGIFFATRLGDHYLTPGYSIAYSGPSTRGAGFSTAEHPSKYLPTEEGQRYPLEASDLTHVFSLSLLKRESDFITQKKRAENKAIFEYGILASYRRQNLDSQNFDLANLSFEEMAKKVVHRNAHLGLSSLWTSFSMGDFHIESELAGIFGKYQIGDKNADLLAQNDDGSVISKQNIWLLQGGFALKSKYGFLNDRLQVGLDGGWASGQKSYHLTGMQTNKEKSTEKYLTNFSFNPAYTVDLLLYREVLGRVSGSFYIKPHLSYFFSRNFGLRGDVITSFADFAQSTPGNSKMLGVELDAASFMRTESGFYFSLAYGVLFPLAGLNHQKQGLTARQYQTYGEAKTAHTLQLYFGLTF